MSNEKYLSEKEGRDGNSRCDRGSKGISTRSLLVSFFDSNRSVLNFLKINFNSLLYMLLGSSFASVFLDMLSMLLVNNNLFD